MADFLTLAKLATAFATEEGQRIIAVSDNEAITQSDFHDRVDDWQYFFSGIPGRRFALLLDNAAELAAALWGAWHAGKTIVLPGDKLPDTLKQLASLVDACIGEMPLALPVPVKGSAQGPMQRLELDSETTGLVIFTSGSSGEPVAIKKQLKQLQAEVAALEACFGNTLGDAVIYGTVSHQHIYGLLFRVLWPLASRRTFHTQRLEYPEQIAKRLSGKASVLIASPAHLKRLPENLDWQAMTNVLRAVFSSGGPLSAESSDKVTQLWLQRPIEVFGSSETGGIAWRQPENGTAGWQPLPGVEWKLVDQHLQIRSPHLPDGQWFHTCDRAAARDGNKFELLGRSDRIIKLEERRISLSAIENNLQASAWIQDCKLLVLPGQRDRLAAVVVLNDAGKQALLAQGKLPVVNQLRSMLEACVDPIAIPRHWRFLDAMPMDSQGKTSQRTLAGLFRLSLPPNRILQRAENSARLALEMHKDLIVFDGHFSQHAAVVPGVALIDWAIKHFRHLFGIDYRFLRIEALKFQQVIRPGFEINLDLQWNAAKGILMFVYESGHGVHSNGRIVFASPDITSSP